jgi:glycine cleavage system H lipoate-binding protein
MTVNDIIKDFADIDEDESLFVGLQNKTHKELCDIIFTMAKEIESLVAAHE